MENNEKNSLIKETPFRGPRKPVFTNRIGHLDEAPDKFVRAEKLDRFPIEKFQDAKTIFEELENRYNIAVPKMDFVVGKEYGSDKMFTLVDKIEGKNILDIRRFEENDKEELEKFFSGMATYYYDILQNGGKYWLDFGSDQFVFGHRKGESVNRVWLVDVEPYVREHDKKNKEIAYLLLKILLRILALMRDLEFVVDPSQRFEKTRIIFKKMLDSINFRDYLNPDIYHQARLISSLNDAKSLLEKNL